MYNNQSNKNPFQRNQDISHRNQAIIPNYPAPPNQFPNNQTQNVTVQTPRPENCQENYIVEHQSFKSMLNILDQDEFICLICFQILWKPVVCSFCKKSLCGECADNFTSHNPVNQQCPNCRNNYNYINIDEQSTNLGKIKFFCVNKEIGCSKQISYKDLEFHNDQCLFEKVPCYYSPDCKQFPFQQDYQNHLQNCWFRSINCQYCNCTLKYPNYQYHLDKECQMVLINCCYCRIQFQKCNLTDHQQNCDSNIIECEKCQKKLPQQDLKSQHSIEECYQYHTIMTKKYFSKLKDEVKDLQKQDEKNQNEILRLQQKSENDLKNFQLLEIKYKQLQEMVSKLCQQIKN